MISSKVTDILQKHKAGITFFEIQGTGRTPKVTQEICTFFTKLEEKQHPSL